MNGDVHRGSDALFTPMEVRQASGYEGAPDVRHPVFSNCTVPLVMWCVRWGAAVLA